MSDEKRQIHVQIPLELHQRILSVCTESGQISILIRKLLRAFLKNMDIDQAGKDVANKWEDKL